MNYFIWISVTAVFLYSSGFAVSLWKEKNKTGSTAVFILAIIALVLPYFTYMR